jgi:TolB-like protein/Tfp pilus assembly protein PilF
VPNSVWDRLRRRKVVQWTIAYAAGAWGLLQGLQFLTDAFDWPGHVLKLGTVAALLGLPLAFALAWFRGERGTQRASRTELAVVTVLFLVGGALFWNYQRSIPSEINHPVTEASAQPATAQTDTDSGPSVAVLPFDNRSAQADDAYFVDGIQDDILTQLSKVSALKVISRTSVEQFRDTKLPIKTIAGQLGVSSILEGGVQRGGDRVRVNVQLIDAATDAHLWAETYDRELTAANIFAIQSEVAGSIAGALKTKLTAGEQARVSALPTQSLEAWEAYQLGKQQMSRRTSECLEAAERHFRQATLLDPGFALAHVGVADAVRLQSEYGGKALQPSLAAAEVAVTRALEIDPELAEAWASKAGIYMGRAQSAEAEKLLRRAIELNPNYAAAHHWLSVTLRGTGRLDEEIAHAERAIKLDPLSVLMQTNLCDSLAEAPQRYDEAAACYERAIQLDPDSPLAYGSLATLNAYPRRKFAETVLLRERVIALDPGNASARVELWVVLLDLGEVEAARRFEREMVQRWPDDYYVNAVAAVAAGMSADEAAVQRHATRVLRDIPREPYALRMLRNADLRKGRLAEAKARYAAAFPEFFEDGGPRVSAETRFVAIDLALLLKKSGDAAGAHALLDGAAAAFKGLPPLGFSGNAIGAVQIHALRGDRDQALAALQDAQRLGWRGPLWRYYRDLDPNLDSLRDAPEFKAAFADIERDMTRERARLAELRQQGKARD